MPLTPQGYVATTTDDEVANLNAKFLANVDAGLDLSPDQPFGNIIAAFAERFANLTEAQAAIYQGINPAGAEGDLLNNVCALTGTLPNVATYSTVVATLNLNAGTTVNAGATAIVAGQPNNVWVLLANAVNSGGITANITATFRSQTAGIFKANATTLTIIGTPTPGWNSVTNLVDSVDGLAADTDTTLRQRRDAELAGEGSGDIDAIRAAVLKVEGVISAFVFENTTFHPDTSGLPGKSFRVVIWDGASPAASNTDIATAIWSRKPSGIASYGATSATITDSSGNPQAVNFDRAQQLRTYVTCTTTPASLTTPQTTSVKAAIKAFADTNFGLGVSIIARSFSASPLEPVSQADATSTQPAYVPPVTDVPTFAFDFVSSPVNTGNKTVTQLQIATVATTDILVNGV